MTNEHHPKRGFVRRHKLAVGTAALGAAFVLVPKHRATIAAVVGTVALMAAGVIGALIIVGLGTPSDTTIGPPPAGIVSTAPPVTPVSEWCWATPKGGLC